MALAIAGFVCAQAPPSPPPTALHEGFVGQRKIARGETHPYEIVLRQGDYVQATIEQQGADVAEKVTAPDGTTVIEADTPGAEYSPDALAFVAPADGRYAVDVRVVGRMAPDAGYELRVEAVRPPTPTDLRRLAIVRRNADISKLHPERDTRRVLDMFLENIRDWDELGEPRLRMWNESYAGYMLGEFLDRSDEAIPYHDRALASARAVGDTFAEAYVLNNRGVALTHVARFEEARQSQEEALRLHRAAGRRFRVAIALVGLGGIANHAGDLQGALDLLLEALRIYEALGEARYAGVARLNIGPTYVRLGEHEAALEHYRLALPVFGKDQRLRARVLMQMSVPQSALGDRAAARASLEEALAMYRTLQNRGMEASTSTTLAVLEREEGHVEAAAQRLEEAVRALTASGFRVFEARALCELGETRRQRGDLRGAREALERILPLVPEPGSPDVLCAEAGLARVARDEGDLAAARTHVERALVRAEAARGSLASLRSRASALAGQQALYELAVDVHMRQHDADPAAGHDVAALEMSERARARSLLELLSEGGADIREGVDGEILAEERALGAKLNGTAEAHEQALAAGKTERAETLRREVTLLMARLAELEARIRRVSPRYAALTRPEPLSARAIQREVLDPGTLLLEYALGAESSYAWVVSPDTVRSYRLAPKAEIESAARVLYERLRAPQGRTAGREEAAALSRLVLGPLAGVTGDKRLLIVAPGLLQYVPFGVLPVAVAGAAAVPLLSRHEVVNAPSASVVAVIRREAAGRAAGGRTVAVLADPVYGADDPRVRRKPERTPVEVGAGANATPSVLGRSLRSMGGTAGSLTRLPFSRREADAIAALVPPAAARKALGFEASRETALSPDLRQYRIVHIAAHGLLDTRRAELSGVVLSLVDEDGNAKDGFLRFHDVYNMKLGADLVVLSGCQTGLGKDLQGEGLVGLTRGFMYAGARRVVASLWQVDDESTAELMKRFYRALLKEGRRPPDALRQAQLELSRHPRFSAPFYWAGFALQGDWR